MRRQRGIAIATMVLVAAAWGCRDDGPTEPAELPSEGEVFLDEYSSGLTFQAFAGSKLDAVQVDQVEVYEGTASLRVSIPSATEGGYAGGAFTTTTPRDLTEFDALTFWAKASTPATLNVAGLGNDNTESSQFIAERGGIALTSTWTKYVIPIPLASKLSAEDGLFFFAEGPEEGQANTIWFDEMQFETLGTLANPRPAIGALDIPVAIGATATVTGTAVTYDVAGTDITVAAAPGYFTFTSSDETVATVDGAGVISVVGEGSATITAALGETAAAGEVVITAVSPPEAAAPTPTEDAADVVSLFSDDYTDVTVDTWSTSWDNADVTDVMVDGNATKRYTNLVFAGIEATSSPIDASSTNRFRMDIWTPDATADPVAFKVKLVDAGADGVIGTGGDDSEHEITFTAATDPALETGSWVSLDVPLNQFAGLTGTSAIAQLIISGDPNTVYVDNVYFYAGEVTAPTEPSTAAPTPTEAEADVISMFSDEYTDVTVDRWSTDWDNASVSDVTVAGDAVKLYSGLVFAGIEATSSPIDASTMTHFHMDIWTPDATADPAAFKVKLVDAGADGTIGTGGDDSEHELTFTASTTPGLETGTWVSLDIPFSDFTGLTGTGALAQLIISGDPNTVYVDNVYFHK